MGPEVLGFGKGIMFGLAVAAPVGPIGLLCIRYAMTKGFKAGFQAGLGAAVADGFYGVLAVFGLAGLGAVVQEAGYWLGIAGGLFLLWIGGSLLRRSFGQEAREQKELDAGGWIFPTTFVLTLSNPMTILTFVGLFTALEKAGNAFSLTVQSLVVVGVFLGSAVWWLFLAGIATKIGARIGSSALGWIDRASGILIFGFGVLALYQVLG